MLKSPLGSINSGGFRFLNRGLSGGLPAAAQISIPTGVWIDGDSYAGYVLGGFTRYTSFEQPVTSTGGGGSTFPEAVARVATNQATYADRVLVFWDGIYNGFTTVGDAATTLDELATNAGSTEWIYIAPIIPNENSAEAYGLTLTNQMKTVRDNALAAYPDNTFDPWPILEGLAADANDDADVAAGFLPRSIYLDNLHLTAAAVDALMDAIITLVRSKWPTVDVFVPSGTPDTILGANLLSYIDPSAGGLLQTTGGVAAVADGDPIQVIPDQADGVDLVSNTLLNRASYRTSGGLSWIEAREAYFEKALPRTGDVYMCAAFRFPNPSTSSHRMAVFYDTAPFYQGDYYAIQRDPYVDPIAGVQLESNTGSWFTGEANTSDVYVVEMLLTDTERTFVLRREDQLTVTTTIAGAAVTDSLRLTLFGADSDTVETAGDIDLYSFVVADTIPTAAQRNNLVHHAAAKAGLSILPPAY